jgi:hypothetical protein
MRRHELQDALRSAPPVPTFDRGAPAQVGTRRRSTVLESLQDDNEPSTQLPPNWMYKMPPNGQPIHATGQSQALANFSANEDEDLAIIKVQTSEQLVLHSIGLRGYEERDSLDFPGQQEWRDMSPFALFEKFIWSIYVSDASLIQFGAKVDDSGQLGFRTLDTLSVEKGTMPPIVAQPGAIVKLRLTCIDPAAGLDLSPLSSRVAGHMTGYRVPIGLPRKG